MNLDQHAVARGAGAYLAVAAPFGLIVAIAQPSNSSSLWVVVAVAVFLVAPVVGGAMAGSIQPRSPLTQAAAAVGMPAALFFIGVTMLRVAQGRLTAVRVVSYALYLCVFIGLAMAGGYIAFRRHVENS